MHLVKETGKLVCPLKFALAMNVIDDTNHDSKKISTCDTNNWCLLLEVLHEFWVQPNTQLTPECLFGRLTSHDRIRY